MITITEVVNNLSLEELREIATKYFEGVKSQLVYQLIEINSHPEDNSGLRDTVYHMLEETLKEKDLFHPEADTFFIQSKRGELDLKKVYDIMEKENDNIKNKRY